MHFCVTSGQWSSHISSASVDWLALGMSFSMGHKVLDRRDKALLTWAPLRGSAYHPLPLRAGTQQMHVKLHWAVASLLVFYLWKLPDWEWTDSPTWSWQHMIIAVDCDADASLPSPSWFSFSFFYILAQKEKTFFQFLFLFSHTNNVIGFYLICVLHIVVLRIMITIYTLLIDYAGTTVLRVIWITFFSISEHWWGTSWERRHSKVEKAQASCLKHLVWILGLPPLSSATLNKLFNSSDPRFPDAKWAQ